MNGIIATNDPAIVDVLAKEYPNWTIIIAQTKSLIEYYPLPLPFRGKP